MLAARKEYLGTIELLAQENKISTSLDAHSDDTLVELFQRLGQAGEFGLVAGPEKNRLAEMQRVKLTAIDCEIDYAPADLIALEVELAQELSMVLNRLQR